jgi:type II secretory pathway pseudopilin PulG
MMLKHAKRLRHDEAGFTLVETLAAFTMLTLVLVVLLGGLSQMAGRGRDAEVMREALRLAKAKLDGIGITEPLAAGESAGRFENGFEWRLRIRETAKLANGHVAAAAVEIAVSGSANGVRMPPAVSLATFKLAGPPQR